MAAFPERFLIVDFETDGVDAKRCNPVEVAIVAVENMEVIDLFTTFIAYPDGLVYPSGLPHDILLADLVGAPDWNDAGDQIKAFAAEYPGAYWVAHNGDRFDFKILERTGVDITNRIDTLPWLRKQLPGQPSYAQAALGAVLGIDTPNAHRALPDCMQLLAILTAAMAAPVPAPVAKPDAAAKSLLATVDAAVVVLPEAAKTALDGVKTAMTAFVDAEAARLGDVLAVAQSIPEVNSDAELAMVIDVVGTLRKLSASYVKARTGQLKPIKDVPTAIEAVFRDKLIRPIDLAIVEAEDKAKPYQLAKARAEEERRRNAEIEAQRLASEAQAQREAQAREQAAAAAAAAELFGGVDASAEVLQEGQRAAVELANVVYDQAQQQLAAPSAPVRTTTTVARTELKWRVEVVAPGAVPREYLTPDIAAITAAVAAARGVITIPGIVIHEEIDTAYRARR